MESASERAGGESQLMMKLTLAALLFIFLIFVYIQSYIKPQGGVADKDFAEIRINNVLIKAEIADTGEKRAVGLMNRTSLDNDSGMLFIFENEGYHQFWMKDTLISLEILFIDKNLTIVQILEMEPCRTSDWQCTIYSPNQPIKYALELNVNFSKLNNVKIGDKIKIEKR